MTTPRMPALTLRDPWIVLDHDCSGAAIRMRLQMGAQGPVDVTLQRSLASVMRDSYPVGAHDVHVVLDAPQIEDSDLATLLRDLVGAVETADPACRRLVYAVPVADLAVMAAAERAGFRFVVDVDVDGEELALLVAEPDWVTKVDSELEQVPGT